MAKARTFAVYENTSGTSPMRSEPRDLRFIACVRATVRTVSSAARKVARGAKNLTIVEDRDCASRRR